MLRLKRSGVEVGLILLVSLLGGCAQRSSMPSMPEVKRQVREYYESGRYEADIARALRGAREHLEKNAGGEGKPALVLDIDETSLSNYSFQKSLDFGYDAVRHRAWQDKTEGTPIRPVLELYNQARQKGVAVFFITGRRERHRKATEQNLVLAGYPDWQHLAMKPDDFKGKTAEFKASERKAIVDQGYRVILNVGDQQSDLDGGYAEKAILLPNPFYDVN